MRITDEELRVMELHASDVQEEDTNYSGGWQPWRRAFAAEVARDCARLIAEARTDDPGTALACADMIRERYGVE